MSADHNGYGVSADTFQAIIQERNAEKSRRAEEKRVKVSKCIRDRKSNSGINPLDQFPTEIWNMVLDELKESKDLSNISQVHDIFNDLLESKKMRDILLPQVLDLPIQTDPTPRRKVLPLAHDLKMRAVSKSMRNGIDRWYEDNLLKHLRSGKNLERDSDEIPTICLQDSKVVTGLLKNFVSSRSDVPKAKRFHLRSIRAVLTTNFREDNDNVQDEEKRIFQEHCANQRSDIRSLLEVIGDQIWHFVYRVGNIDLLEERGITLTQIYDTLVEWAHLMPNLKWLELYVGADEYYNEQRKGASIASRLAIHLFPTLRQLERLDMKLNSTSIEVFEIYEAILATNRHLKRLHFDAYNFELFDLEHFPVARVQQMDSLETLCLGDEWNFWFNWGSIQSLLNSQWPLKQIQLGIGISVEDITIGEVFLVLENFPTLEQVALNITNIWIAGDLKFLELQNLIELELNLEEPIIDFTSSNTVQFFFSLQFLLCCKNLKKLRWEINNTHADSKLLRFITNHECHERMINFRGGYRNLNHSNIWDVFPYLDTVEVHVFDPTSCRPMKTRIKRMERVLPNDE